MIIETVLDLFVQIMISLISTMEIINLPTQLIDTLTTLTAYGAWVCGIDILAIFVSSVIFWWGVHMSVGLAIWVWERLPLT